MDDRVEMKPCPFCGSACEERAEKGWFACSNNDCSAWHLQALAEEWNKRDAPAAEKLDIEAAAKKLAACMDYPWEHMPEQGRASMREHATAVISAALSVSAETESHGE